MRRRAAARLRAWHDFAMSLATRCTSCGTAFRVVQDQLKVSEGWVRCGRCDAVFNALEGLFDLGRDAPAEWEEPAPSRWPRAGAAAAGAVAAADAAHRSPRRRRRHRRRCRGARAARRRRLAARRPRRAARRPGRRAPVRTAQALGKRAQAGRPARRARPASSSPTRASTPTCSPTTPRSPTPSCATSPATDSDAAARERSAARLHPPRRPARALAQRPGARRAGRALRVRAPLALVAAGGESLPRQRRRALAGASAGARRLVRARLHADRGAAPDRRGAGREHRAARARSASTPSSSRSRCAAAARCRWPAVDRPEPDRRQRPAGRAPRPRAARLPRRRA